MLMYVAMVTRYCCADLAGNCFRLMACPEFVLTSVAASSAAYFIFGFSQHLPTYAGQQFKLSPNTSTLITGQ